ncbi:calcium/sodium antiporter [Roseicitreum antarcticum]|uniref:Cation:H+ antiporter n=1 Tax=Roseicitreum antarcticum TaxID=564137 RepID=A0A1H2R2Q4_9RHOB|nr:calcium/sodium antiporter [Roseicitreum antarcticum]SDW13726.1 cation:H+ antiporter [Roseicitreum antarcticum]
MLLDIVLILVGLGLLLVAGDALTKGAVNLAIRMGIPAIIVGLTVVAFGTSAPEMLVSVDAVLSGAPGLALGNVVGSNTANILLVLGAPALISAMTVERSVARDFLTMIAATVLFIAVAFFGPITTPHALILLAGLGLMLADNYRSARAHQALTTTDSLEGADPGIAGTKIAFYLAVGVIGLPLGAQMLVGGATSIASALGVSDALIGLTLVAVGTSLPELATTVMAAIRRESGIAIGNIIGSNVFNLLAIIGIASLIGPIPVPDDIARIDLWVMLGASLVLAPFIWLGWRITRGWGVVLLLAYAGYVATLVMRGSA